MFSISPYSTALPAGTPIGTGTGRGLRRHRVHLGGLTVSALLSRHGRLSGIGQKPSSDWGKPKWREGSFAVRGLSQVSKLRAPQQRLAEADPRGVLGIYRFNDFVAYLIFVSRDLIGIDDRR